MGNITMKNILLKISAALLFFGCAIQSAAKEPLKFDEAFKIVVSHNDSGVSINLETAPQHYLYKEKTFIKVNDKPISDLEWTGTQKKEDMNYGLSSVVLGQGNIKFIPSETGLLNISITTQGCSKEGLCYIPQTKLFTIDGYAGAKKNKSRKELTKEELMPAFIGVLIIFILLILGVKPAPKNTQKPTEEKD